MKIFIVLLWNGSAALFLLKDCTALYTVQHAVRVNSRWISMGLYLCIVIPIKRGQTREGMKSYIFFLLTIITYIKIWDDYTYIYRVKFVLIIDVFLQMQLRRLALKKKYLELRRIKNILKYSKIIPLSNTAKYANSV